MVVVDERAEGKCHCHHHTEQVRPHPAKSEATRCPVPQLSERPGGEEESGAVVIDFQLQEMAEEQKPQGPGERSCGVYQSRGEEGRKGVQ